MSATVYITRGSLGKFIVTVEGNHAISCLGWGDTAELGRWFTNGLSLSLQTAPLCYFVFFWIKRDIHTTNILIWCVYIYIYVYLYIYIHTTQYLTLSEMLINEWKSESQQNCWFHRDKIAAQGQEDKTICLSGWTGVFSSISDKTIWIYLGMCQNSVPFQGPQMDWSRIDEQPPSGCGSTPTNSMQKMTGFPPANMLIMVWDVFFFFFTMS